MINLSDEKHDDVMEILKHLHIACQNALDGEMGFSDDWLKETQGKIEEVERLLGFKERK